MGQTNCPLQVSISQYAAQSYRVRCWVAHLTRKGWITEPRGTASTAIEQGKISLIGYLTVSKLMHVRVHLDTQAACGEAFSNSSLSCSFCLSNSLSHAKPP